MSRTARLTIPLTPHRQFNDVPLRLPLHRRLVSFLPPSKKPHQLIHTPSQPSVLVFIITMLLLSADFYYLKNIAGRRLVGLRWWNEVNSATGTSNWVFESSDPNTRTINPTDKRFFWLSLYVTPALWVGLAILAIVRFIGVIWLSLIGEFCLSFFLSVLACFVVVVVVIVDARTDLSLIAIALVLTITNTLAFSRCDQFSQASNIASSAFYTGGFARSLASNMVGRLFR